MERICIDFDIILGFLQGEPSSVEKIRYYIDEEICITPFTAYALLRHVNKKEIISQFLSHVTILPFDLRSATLAANIKRYLDSKNMHVNMEHIFNAAICISHGAFLASKNRRAYEGITGLKLV